VAVKGRDNTKFLGDFAWEISANNNLDLEGICVSMWKRDIPNLDVFSMKDVDDMHDAVGGGFGPRDRCYSLGINAYFGPRRSARPHPTPSQGPGPNLYSSSYYRHYYSYPEKQASLIKKLKSAAERAINVFRDDNDNYLCFTGHKTCDKIIYTSGTSSERNRRMASNKETGGFTTVAERKKSSLDYLGFCNSPHRDLCDLLPNQIATQWIQAIPDCPRMQQYLHQPITSTGGPSPTSPQWLSWLEKITGSVMLKHSSPLWWQPGDHPEGPTRPEQDPMSLM